jgi:hypothetical protein
MNCSLMNRSSIAWMIAVVAFWSLLACQHVARSSGQPDNLQREEEKNPELNLLHKYGWTVEGEPTDSTIEVPTPVDRLLVSRLQLLASKRIGLDFTDQAGKTLPMRIYRVTNEAERGHEIRAYLVLADKKLVGAWLSVFGEDLAPNIYALNVNPHKLKQTLMRRNE